MKMLMIGLGIIFLVMVLGIGLLIVRVFQMKDIQQAIKIESRDGIEEETVIEVGGIPQYLNIRGKSKKNPIILLLHGSMPMTTIIHMYQIPWENEYTVVNWDRRGAGETYYLNQKESKALKATLTPEQFIRDIDEVIDYLRNRFDQEKIILLADSEGTTFAPRYVQAHPEKVLLYIGSAQVNDMAIDLKRCKEELLLRIRESGKTKDLEAIKKLSVEIRDTKQFIQTQECLGVFAEKYLTGSTAGEMLKMIVESWKSPYGKLAHMGYFSLANTYNEAILAYASKINLLDYGKNYKVPMIFITGERDWITCYTIQDYYRQIEAPYKKMCFIPKAGHNVLQTHAEVFYKIMHQAIQEAV